jgi:hypothetical protein
LAERTIGALLTALTRTLSRYILGTVLWGVEKFKVMLEAVAVKGID